MSNPGTVIIIDTLGQANSGTYPLVNAKDVGGGSGNTLSADVFSGTPTDGYVVQSASGVPFWAPVAGGSGYSGFSGYSGDSGLPGGTSGYSGMSGMSGAGGGQSGYSGEAGPEGASGVSGYSGQAGSTIIYMTTSGTTPNQLTKTAYLDNQANEWILSTVIS